MAHALWPARIAGLKAVRIARFEFSAIARAISRLGYVRAPNARELVFRFPPRKAAPRAGAIVKAERRKGFGSVFS